MSDAFSELLMNSALLTPSRSGAAGEAPVPSVNVITTGRPGSFQGLLPIRMISVSNFNATSRLQAMSN